MNTEPRIEARDAETSNLKSLRALCRALYTAYQSTQDGRSVISGFVGRGR